MDRLPTKELDSIKILKDIVSSNADKLGPIVFSNAVRKDLINHLSCRSSFFFFLKIIFIQFW